VRPACLICSRRTTMTGSSSDQSSQFDCLALVHSSRSWKETELNPNEVRTAHSQTNRHQQEDRQRLEVRDTVHATNTSQRRYSLIRTSRTPGCQFGLPVRKSSCTGGPSNAVSPNSTPTVPVKMQPDRPEKIKFDVGDVTNELPASTVGMQAGRVLIDSTGSNPEDHVGISSVSPVLPTSDVQLMRPVADGISASISQAGAPSFHEVRADTEMSASNYDRRSDDDDLYDSGDEEIYSTVGVDQTHSDDPVSHNGESHDDVRASDNGVQEIWIWRAKGRVSSTTTQFVRSCILRGNTANSRATISFLPVKSKSVVPRKFDYMTVPDLTQFIKKDQNVQEDPSRFDFTQAELMKEVNNDELQTNVSESSTQSQKNGKVPFPRSNPAREIWQIDMDQSKSCISSRSASMLIDQSEFSVHVTSDQSEAARAQLICYKSSCHHQFVSPASLETESSTIDATNSALRKTSSNSIDFIENSARPHSASFLRRITSKLPWLVRSSRRILKRRTTPRKLQRYRLIRALYAVTSLCSSPIIAVICCYIMESLGMVSLWSIQALMLGMANISEVRELHSDD